MAFLARPCKSGLHKIHKTLENQSPQIIVNLMNSGVCESTAQRIQPCRIPAVWVEWEFFHPKIWNQKTADYKWRFRARGNKP